MSPSRSRATPLVEGDETFRVNLSDPSANATIADAQAIGTIVDDDVVRPALTIADASVTEGDSGQTESSFTVTLSSAATEDVTVEFATADDTATAPADYTARTGTLTIPAGELSGQVTVAVQGDTLVEGDEIFRVNLSNPSANATIADAQAIGTIVDDDVVRPALTVTKDGTGTGTVSSDPPGIDCGTICSALFPEGSLVTLSATPDAGSVFTGWTGDCSGTDPLAPSR